MSETESCTIYLHSKIKQNIDKYDDIGLMTANFVKQTIANNSFKLNEVRGACDMLCDKGVFDRYMVFKCKECNKESYYLERQPEKRSTEVAIREKGVIKCKHYECENFNSIPKNYPFDYVYAVGRLMINDKDSNDYRDRTIWERFLSLIGFK